MARAASPGPDRFRGSAGREPLWTAPYAVSVASLHLFFLAWAMLFTTLPLYLEDARKWQVGWVVGGAFGVMSLLVRTPSGRLADRFGRRPLIVIGGGLAAASLAGHALTSDPLLLTPLRLINGLGSCLYTTAAMALLADALPLTRRGEAAAFGMRAFFVVAGMITAAAALLVLPLREARRPALSAGARPRLISRPALLPAVTFLTLTVAFSVLTAFLALYATQEELGRPRLFFLLMGLSLMPARWFGGTLADRLGRAAVILPGFFIAAAGMLLLAAARSPAMLYLAGPLFGLGFGLGHTGLTILTVDRAAPEERGAAMATFTLAWDIGTLGAFALGFMGDAVGLSALFAAAGVLPLLAAALFQFARSRTPHAAPPVPIAPAGTARG
jgi:MFS family permease